MLSFVFIPVLLSLCEVNCNMFLFCQKSAEEEEISPNEYLKLRTQQIQAKKDAGEKVYPHKFHVSHLKFVLFKFVYLAL